MQPFFLGTYMLAPRLLTESVYFAYVPLNSGGRAQHLLERAKIEYDFPRLRFGGGYGAYKSEAGSWEHKPFATATMKLPHVGNIEVWLQALPDDHLTLQVRYAKVLVQ